MPDQPTPKPLTAEQESALRMVLLDARPHIDSVAPSRVIALLAALDASRAECAALRAAVAEAEKQRDEARKMAHTWQVRAEVHFQAEAAAGVARDALAAELAEARKVVVRMAQMVRWLDCKVADRITITPEQEATINEAYEIVYKAALAARDSGKAPSPAKGGST